MKTPHSPYVFLMDITSEDLYYESNDNEPFANEGNNINTVTLPNDIKNTKQ